jgi:hypothetical protein
MKKLLIVLGVIVLILSIVGGQSLYAAKKSIIKVDDDGAQCSADYSSLPAAVAAASDGDTIQICSGEYEGVLLNKSLHFQGTGQARITDGPLHPAGINQGFRLLVGSEGSSFKNLTFETDLSIINGEAVDDITVEHNTFLNSIQAVTNWSGANWHINHYTITDLHTSCGGGIGILLGDFQGLAKTSGNRVSHNNISGTLQVPDEDCGGYNGTGIVIYSDYRGGQPGGEVFENYVTHNNISLVSDTPNVVDVVAFEMTDTRDDDSAVPYPVIYDNKVGFNDFRGTAMQITLTPTDLENHNDISRNLGDNRGHGLHPSVFH